MSLGNTFNTSAARVQAPLPHSRKRPKRPAPFSIRLSESERARLLDEARGAPLGSYIKAKVLSNPLPVRLRRTGLCVEDRKALAQALALLGQSRLSSNLNQLAYAANIGALPLDAQTDAELKAALAGIRELRAVLLTALGLKPEAVESSFAEATEDA